MLYLSGAEGYSWYASFLKKEKHWRVDDECRITRRELVSFEASGREMELVRTSSWSLSSETETNRQDLTCGCSGPAARVR